MEDKDFNALAGTAMTRIESALEADAEIDFELPPVACWKSSLRMAAKSL